MSEPEEPRTEAGEELEEEEEEYAPTPFDNPFFLPVILLAFALWLGYDGFINQGFIQERIGTDEEWHIGFNRWGAGIAAVFGAWFLFKAIKERRAESEDSSAPSS